MGHISDTSTSLHQSSTEILIHYHIRRTRVGIRSDNTMPHKEVMDACLEGPLRGAMDNIRAWSRKWAPEIAPGFDPDKGPEIALNLNVTSRGNLEVTWTPIMTQEQYDSGSPQFHRWLQSLSEQPIAERRRSQVYFIRDYDTLWRHLPYSVPGGIDEFGNIAVIALGVLLAELPERLSHMVEAHWQDVLDIDFGPDSYGATPTARGMEIYDIWDHSRDAARTRLERSLADVGIDADRLECEWNAVEISNPRVKTDAGRAKVVANVIDKTPDQVVSARKAITNDAQWQVEKPQLWWNRTAPYPHWWGGYR